MKKLVEYLVSRKSETYKDLSKEEYLLKFGFSKFNNQIILRDYQKLENAYKIARDNRDFEINKFWSRAAYFWGFVVLIFGVYIAIETKSSIENLQNSYYQFYLINIGFLFSLGWLYVIKGSKKWQENWEKHIEMLEDYVSGPIYKTIYHSSSIHSVSKINKILAYIVIFIWLGLLYNYLNSHNHFPWNKNATHEPDPIIICCLIFSLLLSMVICTGYAKRSFKNKKDFFIIRKPPST